MNIATDLFFHYSDVHPSKMDYQQRKKNEKGKNLVLSTGCCLDFEISRPL